MRIQEVTKEIAEFEKLKKPKGALIASVGADSPASKAGLKAGDIILEFDGKDIETMRKLPKVVASTEVGKSVELKIWRNKKLIKKRLILGRLESSEEFKEKKASTPKKNQEIEIEDLKITVRDLNNNDIKDRNLKKNQKGVIILDISSRSPIAGKLQNDDIIIEVQKKPVVSSADFKKIIKDIYLKKDKTLFLTIINTSNQRRYIGIKLK